MRLIDADALVKELNFWNLRIVGFFFGGIRKIYDTKEYIDKFPTINPEDLRKKGKWIGIGYDGYADGCPVYDYWECSNCGNEENGEDVPEQNPFCRCCGAKMEG